MILYINPINNLLVGDPLFRNPINKLVYKRRDGGIVRLGFAGETEADASRMIKIGVKPLNDFDAPDFLVFANSYFVIPGSQYYYIAPNFNTVAVNSLFTPNLTSITVSLEVSWSADSGVSWNSSQTVEVQIFNDIIQGGEFFPTPLSSFESQILPILASFTHPINIFDNNLTVNNGSIVVSGSASNIQTPLLIANTLSAQTLISDTLSVSNTVVNHIDAVSESVGYLTSNTIHTAYLSSIQLDVLSGVNIGGTVSVSNALVSGNANIGGTLTANTLSSNSVKSLIVSALSVITPKIISDSVKTLTVSAIDTVSYNLYTTNLTVSNIVGTNLTVPNIIATNISLSNIVSNVILTASNNLYLSGGNVGIKTLSATAALDINSDRFRLRNTFTPPNSATAGNMGEIAFDLNFIYVKTLSGWKRSPLTSF